MHHESLYGRLNNKDITLTISGNVDFGAKCNQKISIHIVNITSGSKNEGKCKVKEVKLRRQAMLQEVLSQVAKGLPDSANITKLKENS